MSPEIRMMRSAPDDVFGIEHFACDGAVVQASMVLHDLDLGVDGRVPPGLLGVLVDNVLGYVALTASPNRWSVTTEMSLAVYPVLQRSTGRLMASARVAQADALSAFTVGEVRNESGEVVASCTQRARFVDDVVPLAEPFPSEGSGQTIPRPAGLLADSSTPDGDALRVEVSPLFQNPLGNLHGGVSLFLSEAAATLTRREVPEFCTTSVHVNYLRAVRSDAHVEFRPRVIHRGRTLSVEDVDGFTDGARRAVVARISAQPLV